MITTPLTTTRPPAGASPQRAVQESQYAVPYHYLPTVADGHFRQHQHWSWGYRYLGRLKVAVDLLAGATFDSLIDIGCGDGRFLAEVAARFGTDRLLGIDVSERAVELARRMNPSLRFEQANPAGAPQAGMWSAAALLEVIEHVPPDSLPAFLEATAELLRPGGRLVLTAPAVAQRRPEKHFQHFEIEGLRELLPRQLTVVSIFQFDAPSRLLRAVVKLMGGSGRHYIVTDRRLTDWVLRHYLDHCLVGDHLGNCQRIACVARKKAA